MTWICSHCGEKFSRYRTRCPSDGQRVIEDLSAQLIGGRYRIRELIGVGGMDSTVWKAWQTGTERVVAVKVLPAAEEAAARRFARGARIAANLNHPNCTVVHDYGRSEDGKLFLVMEFLAGQVLQDILGPEGMSVPDALHVADQVLQALEHAHSQRAVHRDLKPDNLFLCRKNEDPLHVKILDFGIAKYVEEDPENTASAEDGTPDSDGFEDLVTEQRQVCGTPQYMAPEQVVGARIDGRTDLYSLGCVMYRMLTGRLPFDGKTRYELYQKHLQEPPRPFSEIRPDLVFPDRLELIVMKVLSKRPDQRFQSASEMRKALETVDLPDDRARRSNRPRVSLKHTSPQERGSMPQVPTILPGPLWTLSASPPAPPPLPGGRAGDSPELVYPQGPGGPDHNPLVEVDAAMLGKGGHRSGTANLPAVGVPSLPDGKAAGVVLSPSLVAQGQPQHLARASSTGAVGHSTSGGSRSSLAGMLNDAVVRHPASRSPLAVAPEVPRSSETEPNKLGEEGDSRRKRVTVIAVLAGAFLIGVGGVALVMKLTQTPTPQPAEVARTPAEAAPNEAASPEPGANGAPGATGAQGGKAPIAAPGSSGTTPQRVEVEGQKEPVKAPGDAPAPGEATSSDARDAGRQLGATLADARLAPGAEVVVITSQPPGATVTAWGLPGSAGAAPPNITPFIVALTPGTHRFEVVLPDHLPQTVEIVVPVEPSLRGRAVPTQVTLARRPAAATNRPPQTLQRTTPPQQSPGGVRPNISSPTTNPTSTPPGDPVKTPDKPERPQVRLLEDGPGATGTGGDGKKPADKKPTVKLLEDDPAPPKKPVVKVLED